MNLGRVTRTIYPDGNSDSSGYDAEGRRIVSTNRVGQVTGYEYDAVGRLFRMIYPDGTKGFQINAGIRIRGGYSRSTGNPKHAFRLFFRQEYGGALGVRWFCGGNATYSHWMTRTDILDCLAHFGFLDVRAGVEDPNHPHGPCFTVVATR